MGSGVRGVWGVGGFMLQRTGGWGGGVDVVDSGMRNGDWSAGCGKLGCVQLKGEESRDQNSRIGAKYTKNIPSHKSILPDLCSVQYLDLGLEYLHSPNVPRLGITLANLLPIPSEIQRTNSQPTSLGTPRILAPHLSHSIGTSPTPFSNSTKHQKLE